VQAQASYLATAVQTARTFELSSRRHIFDGGAQYVAKNGLTLDANVRQMNRDGAIPFGGSFGHGNVVETIAPVEHKLTDVDSSAEFAHGDLLLRGGYTGSWFHNDETSLTFDNRVVTASVTFARHDSGDTIMRSDGGGSWLADGFKVGDQISVLNTANNNGTFTIAGVAAPEFYGVSPNRKPSIFMPMTALNSRMKCDWS